MGHKYFDDSVYFTTDSTTGVNRYHLQHYFEKEEVVVRLNPDYTIEFPSTSNRQIGSSAYTHNRQYFIRNGEHLISISKDYWDFHEFSTRSGFYDHATELLIPGPKPTGNALNKHYEKHIIRFLHEHVRELSHGVQYRYPASIVGSTASAITSRAIAEDSLIATHRCFAGTAHAIINAAHGRLRFDSVIESVEEKVVLTDRQKENLINQFKYFDPVSIYQRFLLDASGRRGYAQSSLQARGTARTPFLTATGTLNFDAQLLNLPVGGPISADYDLEDYRDEF